MSSRAGAVDAGRRADAPAPVLDLQPGLRIVGTMLGQVASRRRGRSDDVVGARPYVPGDDMRLVSWAATARLSAARGSEQLVVREFHAEEAPTLVVAVDRSASMALFPAHLPWLHKPAAVAACVQALALAAAGGRSQLALLEPGAWLPPRHRLAHDVDVGDTSGPLTPAHVLDALVEEARVLPPGTFVFHLSDFPEAPAASVLEAFAELEWHLVPVVVRDPLWEQSHPVETAGVAVPLAGRASPLRLRHADAERLRERNEREHAELLRTCARAGFPAVVLGSHDPAAIVQALLDWCETMRDAA